MQPTTRRIIRSYGLLIVIALAFLLMALFVKEKDRTVPAESAPLSPASAQDAPSGAPSEEVVVL